MVQGLNIDRTCGNCKWCPGPPEATPCNWRFGMYTGDKFPPRSKVVVNALNPRTMGFPVVVAQPINPGQGIPEQTMEWLTLMSIKVPVVLLDEAAHRGGVIRAILTPDQNKRAHVAKELCFLMPEDAIFPEPLGTQMSDAGPGGGSGAAQMDSTSLMPPDGFAAVLGL